MALLVGTNLDDNIVGTPGDDTLQGLDGNDTLDGGGGNDALEGGAGNDTLYGLIGADLLEGGSGDDQYVVQDIAVRVLETANGGDDTLWTHVDFELSGGLEKIRVLDPGAIKIFGSGDAEQVIGYLGANYLSGGGGNDALYGHGGADNLDGGAGDDWLDGGDGGSVDGGNDTLYGGLGSDGLAGRDGDDWLDGGAGADLMIGGVGNDTYVVDDVGDQVLEDPGEGVDLVLASVDFEIRGGLEELRLLGTASLSVFGSSDGETIGGNAGDNYLFGGGGADTLVGNEGNDRLDGGDGDDHLIGGPFLIHPNHDILFGGAGADRLDGGRGDDWLDGGTGADVMHGGEGNDVYVVDDPNDFVGEGQNYGMDTVYSSVSFGIRPQDEIEQVYLTGTASIDINGSRDSEKLVGNAGDNVIRGGNSYFNPGEPPYSYDQVDWIDGGAGNDTLYGSTPDRTWLGAGPTDIFVFAPGGGHDRIVDFHWSYWNMYNNRLEDILDLSQQMAVGTTWSIQQVGADTLISLSDGDSIVLAGVLASELQQNSSGWIF